MTNKMLPKSQRLNLKKDFKWVASGQKNQTPSLKLWWQLGQNSSPKVGIALSTKEFKKAHDRNRARRLASEAIQKLYSSLKENLNLVIMPKAQVLKKTPQELIEEIKHVKDLN